MTHPSLANDLLYWSRYHVVIC